MIVRRQTSRQSRTSAPMQRPKLALLGLGVAVLLAAGCNGGPRPTLIEPPGPTPAAPLELDLQPAPPEVSPLPPAPNDLTVESSVGDAIFAWARNRSVPYTDSCSVAPAGPGELCATPTERDTVRLLGPSADQIWYVVTVEETSSLELGTGYRVSEVEIAGR